MMYALEVENLTKVYPRFAVKNISFNISQGHIVGLIGANGAGKSTTIKSILGLVGAEGTVKIFGQPMFCADNRAKAHIGYVGGAFRHYPMKKLKRIKAAYSMFFDNWDDAKYYGYLEKFALDEGKKVKELSDGMRVKFALALALSHGARLLILDEPTSGLDPFSREELCDTMLDLARGEGVSILFSTHITSDLTKVADDIIYISDGQILANCPLEELMAKYRIIITDDRESAVRAGAVGVKRGKTGFEGLLERSLPIPGGARCAEAGIDDIMTHMELQKKEERANDGTC